MKTTRIINTSLIIAACTATQIFASENVALKELPTGAPQRPLIPKIIIPARTPEAATTPNAVSPGDRSSTESPLATLGDESTNEG